MRLIIPRLFLLLATLMLLGASLSLQAIVIRHDRADSSYLVDEARYPQLFYLHRTRFDNKACMATLISPQWALTAAHCTDQTPLREVLASNEVYPLSIAGHANAVVELVIHPNYQHPQQAQAVDLALIKLEQVVSDIEPVALYRERSELNKVVSFLGWGFTGLGTVGRRNNDGKFRRAFNTVVGVDQWLQFQFDDPRQPGHQALELEGVPGLGDSGGPALYETEQGPLLMGVAVGEVENLQAVDARQGIYGATEVYERISSHLPWIDGVLKKGSQD